MAFHTGTIMLIFMILLQTFIATAISQSMMLDEDRDLITSIIQRHGEVQNELSEISGRELKSQCVQEALKDVIPRCIAMGVDSIGAEMRKESALKLSICEFENSKVDYPQNCHVLDSERDVDSCVFELKNSPQYWTTFSGNYREITKICFEESLPYEKDQIISLYSNITSLYNRLYRQLRDSHRATDQFQDRLKNKADEIIEALTNIVSQQRHEYAEKQEDMNKEYFKFTENVSLVVSDTSRILRDLGGDLDQNFDQISDHVGFLNSQLRALVDELKDEDFSDSIKHLKYDISSTLSSISNRTEDWMSNMATKLETTDAFIQNSSLKTQRLTDDLRETGLVVDLIGGSVEKMHDSVDLQSELLVAGLDQVENYVNDTVHRIAFQLSHAEYQLSTLNVGIEQFVLKMSNFTSFFSESLSILTNNKIFMLFSGIGSSVAYVWSDFSTGIRSSISKVFETISLYTSLAFCVILAIGKFMQRSKKNELPIANLAQRRNYVKWRTLFTLIEVITIISTLVLGVTAGTVCIQIATKSKNMLGI